MADQVGSGTRLRAIRLPAAAAADAIVTAWDADEAVLPLPLDAPDDYVATLLRTFAPSTLAEVGPHGPEVTRLDGAQPVPAGTALVVATSGSTGPVKGVVLSRAALDASTRRGLRRIGAQRGQRWGLALPLHHVAGIQVVARARTLGTDPVVIDGRDPLAIANADVDHLALVPTQLARVLGAGKRLDHLRCVLVGGAGLEPRLAADAHAAGTPVVTTYGMTETAGGCVYDGVPLEDVEVAVTADGRLKLRGPMLFDGYLRAGRRGTGPASITGGPDTDGWFTTGDHGSVIDGRVRILGRADDVIVSAGENVPAGQVAQRLRSHRAIADVAVVGRADDDRGQTVVAVVVPTDADAPPTLASVREHVRAALPAGWAPHELVLTAELPRDAMGKPTAAALHRLVAGRRR